MVALMNAWAVVRPLLPDLRDVHVYGGGLLLAIGAEAAWPSLGWMVAGGLLLYLGIRK